MTTFEGCVEAVRARFANSLKPYCQALNLYRVGIIAGGVSASLYTAAAGACLAACNTWGVSEGFCVGAGVAAMASDVAGVISLTVIGMESGMKWDDATMGRNFGRAAIGAAGGVVVGAIALKAGKKAGEKLVEKMGGGSCVATLIYTLMAMAAWTNFGVNSHEWHNTCRDISKLQNFGSGSWSGETPDAPIESGHIVGAGEAVGKAKAGGTGSTLTPIDELQQALSGDGGNFPSGQVAAAAAAGPGGDLLNSMPLDKLPAALDQLGTSMNDIGKQLMNQSPASALGGMMGNTPGLEDAADMIKRIDEGIKNGDITANLAGFNSTMSGGGGGSASSKGKESGGFSFGSRGTASTATTTTTMSFGAKNSVETSKLGKNDTDIWHSKWNGTIFQIITQKLDQNHTRVVEMEWQHPLNRAIHGLSNPKMTPPTTPSHHGGSK